MKNGILISIVIYLIAFNCLTSCSCSKEDQILINLRFSDSTNSFIPELNGSVTFESDSQKRIVFDAVKTSHKFEEFGDCEEGCCDRIFNQESKRLEYHNDEHLSIQIYAYALDSFDEFSVVMGNNFPSRPSEFATLLTYVGNEDISNILEHKIKNGSHDSTLKIGEKTFTDVFTFKSNVQSSNSSDIKFAEKIYYNKTEGVIGFVLNDKSLWIKE